MILLQKILIAEQKYVRLTNTFSRIAEHKINIWKSVAFVYLKGILAKKKIKKIILFTVKVKVTQSCPTLCDPMDCIVYGILQARILE